MANQKYTTEITISINEKVFEQVTPEWIESFYSLNTREEIVEHIAFNLVRGRSLSRLEGFANLPDSYAVIED